MSEDQDKARDRWAADAAKHIRSQHWESPSADLVGPEFFRSMAPHAKVRFCDEAEQGIAYERLSIAAGMSFLTTALSLRSAQTESPIEELFLTALLTVALAEKDNIVTSRLKLDRGSNGTLTVRPQAKIGEYRVDFLLTYSLSVAGETVTRRLVPRQMDFALPP